MIHARKGIEIRRVFEECHDGDQKLPREIHETTHGGGCNGGDWERSLPGNQTVEEQTKIVRVCPVFANRSVDNGRR
ncbi:hypothetical protein BJY00DRAFT_287181 [Aspergillus carlsbadensis]|nr:hypothetical protein BJY00DRAFT_287181 [Aspergillus carlsbadensis]